MCQLAQLLVGPVCVRERLGDERLILAQRPLCELERDHRMDEPLLGAVVEIADQAAAGRIGLGEEARARRGELISAVSVRDRGRHELGKGAKAPLGAGRQRLEAARSHQHHAPQAALDADRRADGGPQPALLRVGGGRTGSLRVVVDPRLLTGLAHERGDVVAADSDTGPGDRLSVSAPAGDAGDVAIRVVAADEREVGGT